MDAYTEANNDAREAEAFWWREQHSGCDVEPCAECLSMEALDERTYAALMEEARIEYERDYLPEPDYADIPF